MNDSDPNTLNFNSNLPRHDIQRRIWMLFERPDSGNAAKVVVTVSILAILLSVFSFCLETMPSLQKSWKDASIAQQIETIKANQPMLVKNNNFTNITKDNQTNSSSPCAPDDLVCHYNIFPQFTKNPFWVIETICVIWFIIELSCRFSSSPNKKKFFCSAMNLIDVIAIIPYFLTTTTAAMAEDGKQIKGMSLAVIRVIRLVRVFRIFKLSRHSTGLRILGKTLSSSFRELGLLLFFVLIGVVLFSSAVYFAEIDSYKPEGQSSHFTSIPDAFWWAIVTMTTVGYGDMHPITVAGKLVGSACAVTGILCLALPVPVIVSNFMYYYQRAVANDKKDR